MNKDWYKKEFGSNNGVKEILVTPEMAERWLNANTHNRPLTERRIKRYMQLMIDHKWVQSNDCIIIFDDGNLGNGQHRLWALAEAKEIRPDLEVPILVRWGIPNKISQNLFTMDFIDRGKSRNGGQNWGLRNKLESTKTRNIAAATSLLAKIITSSRISALEPYEINFIYQLYKKEFDLVMEKDKGIRKLSRAPIWAGLTFAAKMNPEKVSEFEELLFTGENLAHGNPILTFRNRVLLNSSTEGRGRTAVFKELLTAIRSFIEEETLIKLYTNDKGFTYFAAEQEESILRMDKFLKCQWAPDLSTSSQLMNP